MLALLLAKGAQPSSPGFTGLWETSHTSMKHLSLFSVKKEIGENKLVFLSVKQPV